MHFREYESADLLKCLSLISKGHDPEFSEARFRWLHEAAPLSPSSIAICEDGNDVVGFYSVIRKTVRLGTKIFIGGRDVDPVVHPAYRGKGVFSQLLQFGLANFKDIDFLFNFANPASSVGFRKHGWLEVEALDDFICQLGFPNPWSKDFLLWLSTFARRKRGRSVSCRRISSAEAKCLLSEPEFMENLFAPDNRLWVERSPAYLKWRYLEHPLNEYLWFLLGDLQSGGGLAICRSDDSRNHLYIIDFLGIGIEPNLGSWIHIWKNSFPNAQATAWSTIPTRCASCFIRNPLRKGRGRKFLVRSIPGRDFPEQLSRRGGWFITRGDLEIS